MVALFVVLTIVFFLGLDWINQFFKQKQNDQEEVEQVIYYRPSIGFSMADGGEEYTPKNIIRSEN